MKLPLPDNFFVEFSRKHQLAVESLTEQQVADAICQMIRSGDFMRNLVSDGSAQSVTYIPFREADRFKALYDELIYAVESKHEGESRHETALRYIQERERTPYGGESIAKASEKLPTSSPRRELKGKE